MQLTEEIAEPEFLLADTINVSRITPPGNLNLWKVADILKTILRRFQRETLLRTLDTPCFQEVRKIWIPEMGYFLFEEKWAGKDAGYQGGKADKYWYYFVWIAFMPQGIALYLDY